MKKRTLSWKTILCIALLVIIGIPFIGIRWGFTPLPKPPVGLRLHPLLLPLTDDALAPTNAAYFYLKATTLMLDYRESSTTRSEIESLVRGESVSAEELKRTLNDCHPSLDLVRQGAALSFCQMPWRDPLEEGPTALGTCRSMARLLDGEGRLALRSGDFDRAASNFLVVVKFGTDCGRGGPLISMLVGESISERGCDAIRAAVLDGAPSATALRHIITQIVQIHNAAQPLAETFRYELIATKQMLDSPVAGTNRFVSFVLSGHVTQGLSNAALGDFIREAERPLWEFEFERLVEKWCPEKHSGLWMLNRPAATMLVQMMIPAIGSAPKKYLACQANWHGTVLVCAVKAFTVAHGTPPERLDQLVPELLPAVPLDPFDGRPMRYRLKGDRWVVWSVGPDRKDDQAERHVVKYRVLGDAVGGDIYFQSTEQQDDREWRSQQSRRGQPPPQKSRFQ